MISLSVAKQTVMDQPYFKKLEIFEILENGSEWIFIINGINDKGTLLMPQPFVRLVNKENGEIKTLNYNDDFDFINTHYVSYTRKKTLLESKYYIIKCFDNFEILNIYESEDYHKFILKHKILDIKTTLLIDRVTSKLTELKPSNKKQYAEIEFKEIKEKH